MVTGVHAASFDCAKARSKVEILICGNADLSMLDEKLDSTYKSTLKKHKRRELLLKYQQSVWLAKRNRCSDVSCVTEYYHQQISELANPNKYELVMSKDAGLCNEMDEVYNKADGWELLNNHIVQWQNNQGVLWARFDINNDGTEELVFKVFSSFNGVPGEGIYIFPSNSDLLTKLTLPERGRYGLAPKEVFDTESKFDPEEYYLKDLPHPLESALVGKARNELSNLIKARIKDADLRPFISRSFSLKPFSFNNTTYVSITDLVSVWIVVAKYKQAEEMEDFCYFYNPESKSQ